MLVFVIVAAPLVALGPRKISNIPDSWAVPQQCTTRARAGPGCHGHCALPGIAPQTAAHPSPSLGLRCWPQRYSSWRPLAPDLPAIHPTQTGYTYGALATPIAFLLFAFFLGFAIA